MGIFITSIKREIYYMDREPLDIAELRMERAMELLDEAESLLRNVILPVRKSPEIQIIRPSMIC